MDYWNWVRERILFERILAGEIKVWQELLEALAEND